MCLRLPDEYLMSDDVYMCVGRPGHGLDVTNIVTGVMMGWLPPSPQTSLISVPAPGAPGPGECCDLWWGKNQKTKKKLFVFRTSEMLSNLRVIKFIPKNAYCDVQMCMIRLIIRKSVNIPSCSASEHHRVQSRQDRWAGEDIFCECVQWLVSWSVIPWPERGQGEAGPSPPCPV